MASLRVPSVRSWRNPPLGMSSGLSWVVDAAVLVLLVVIVVVADTAQLFKIVFFALALAAFLWDLESFKTRAAFWCGVTSVVLAGSVLTGRAPVLELIDLVFFAGVLMLIHLVGVRREEAAAEVDRLLEEQRAQVARLQDLAELKADFTAMVVHEFGNPLAALRRLNEMMGFDGLDAEARSFVLESSKAELGVLETLVADVSATVAVEREDFRVELHAVAIGALMDHAETYGRSVCAQHVFTVDVDEEFRLQAVLADRDRIAQVIRNLVSNAAKYSPAGGRIIVRASRTRPGVARFEVADEGRGITQADLERVFDKFGRGSPRATRGCPGSAWVSTSVGD